MKCNGNSQVVQYVNDPFFPCQKNFFTLINQGYCKDVCPYFGKATGDPLDKEKAIRFVAIKTLDEIEFNSCKYFRNRTRFIKTFIRLFNRSLGKDQLSFRSDDPRKMAKELVEDVIFKEDPLPTGSTLSVIVDHVARFIRQLDTQEFICYNRPLFDLMMDIRLAYGVPLIYKGESNGKACGTS